MKKQTVSGFFIAGAASFALISGSAAAATLPPGNPFYFMQDGMRSLRRTFTFNSVGKALLEIRLVGERQADIAEVMTANKDESVVRAAFSAYGDEVQTLSDAVRGMGDDRVLGGIADLLLAHGEFLGGIAVSGSVPADAVTDAKRRLAGLAIAAFGDAPVGAFRARIGSLVEQGSGEYPEIMAAETLVGFQFEAERTGRTAFAREIRFTKYELEVSFIGRMKGGTASVAAIAQLTGDRVARMYVLEEMRARVGDVETKTAIGFVERQVASVMLSERLLGASVAREAIMRAAGAVAATGAKASDEAAYFIDQANMFLMNNAYDLSLQNAVAAYVSATNAAIDGSATGDDLRAEIASLKRRYDGLRAVKPAFIEKRISVIADMAGKAPARDTLAAIREMKLILAILGK